MKSSAGGPLTGLRVLEIGHFVAAPFCTRLLGDLGADVIKIEPPGGDPVRQWGAQVDGRSLWWSIHARNKRSVVMNLKARRAPEIILGLAAGCDVVVENFRPGGLERLGLGDEAFRAARPDLILAHISGFGQDGPYRDRAAFGVIGEAMGGIRHLTDHPPGTSDLPPVRVGVSIGDSLAGLYAAFGIVSALWQRDRHGGDGKGRSLDVALTDSILSLMEGMLAEYGRLGTVRQPTGSAIPTAAPSNAYPSADGTWILIAANSEPLFARLSRLIGRPDLTEDPRFAGNRARVAHAETLDAIIAAWTRRLPAEEVTRRLNEADIPNTRVYTAADCAADVQFRHRGMVREVEDPLLGRLLHPGIVPHVPEGPGTIRWTGPAVGAHTDEVLHELLGLTATEISSLRDEGAIG
ncbi:CaiB/BaiF CoA transferase family protein [Pinisolibacter aquiterrae]|uniref:CaiB/BaiF CoA transferase family protein n=1 Tax=Pinisolibacter aquiterrae TaxID=2815579 RepID=UPI001C3C988E|nr:CoA transferase [Pinisolibacter aquiterrae]MBV5263869.1 CoA transferase [Pinisolibacter aquiterrae]MCC8235728.1 CoA transferase [Pinisolibacter aquiterrae]